MFPQKKVLNPQVFLEFVCFLTFAVVMVHLVSTGKYQSYVTPRMVPYFYFTAAVMVIWALGGLSRLFQPQHKIRAAHCFVLAMPIMLLLLPHTPINAADLSSGYLSGKALSGFSRQSSDGAPGGQGSSKGSDFNAPAGVPADQQSTDNTNTDETPSMDTATPDNSPSPSDTTASDGQAGIQEDKPAVNLPGLDIKNKRITVANDDFGLWIYQLYTNMEKYKGYTVIMTGFVFKDETMEANEFVPARLAMTCCVADLSPCGLLCKYDKASGLKADAWVTVEGTLHMGKYKQDGEEYEEPQISVTKITPAREVKGYVYPY